MDKYWFPAKTFGWGWGVPTVWQGWVVLAVFFALVLLGALRVLPGWGQLAFVGYMVGISALLIGVCWLTGEPPRWRS